MDAVLIDSMGGDLTAVNAARTKTQRRIVEAKQRGYYITEQGELFGPKGKVNVSLHGKQRYPTFSSNWAGYVYGIPVHQFAAYCFYGELAFSKDVVVRHINGSTLDFSKQNIRLGSHSDNNMDKCPEKRKAAAIKARMSQGIVPNNAKLTKKDVLDIRDQYSKLNGEKAPNGFATALANKYNVSKTVIYKVVKGEYYASYID